MKWFCSYSTNRKQCCKVNGKISIIESITCGVPQGSCLGPLLFIIYINDLHLHMKHCDVNMYADDTSLMFASDSAAHINDCVNDDLNNLKPWLQGRGDGKAPSDAFERCSSKFCKWRKIFRPLLHLV